MTVLSGEGTHQVLYGSADIHAGMRRNRGFIARPDHAGSFRTVILVHDVWGITGYVKDLMWRLARHGFALVAPNLNPNRPPPGSAWEEANRLYQSSSNRVRPLADAYEFIRSPDTPWSLAGWAGLLAVGAGSEPAAEFAREAEVDAIALISGVGHDRFPLTSRIMAIHGRDDERTPLPPDLGRHIQWVLYDGVGHDFLNDHGPDYHDAVARDVAARLVSFFRG